MRVSQNGYVNLGFVQATSLSSATTLASLFSSGAIPAGAEVALIGVLMSVAGYVMMRDDGTAPTASIGFPLPSGVAGVPGSPFFYQGDLSKVQFILGATGTLTSLNVAVYGIK